MSRRLIAAGLVLGVAAAAGAIEKGDVLYVRSRDTAMLKKPVPTADTAATLQPGSKVTYIAPAPAAVGWHEVTAVESPRKPRGFVYQSNLSKKLPNQEVVVSHGPPLNPQAFASSGAASRAFLTAGDVRYGTQTHPELAKVVRDIQDMEKVAKSVTTADWRAHERAVGLTGAFSGGGKR